ncbi:YraN family protein [Kineococcus arenarius]|uniref:YraN family protein n=1 Tax=Kineococcus sp. SYSU DK007 TaxID=3383128 RepID=UPI003D7C990A
MRAKDGVGRYGERLAARRLTEAGMTVLETNWRCPAGEIDIVARDGDCLVVCEVKTRRSTRAGSAVEAVTPAKVARLRRLVGQWLSAHPGLRPAGVRLDVVAVTLPARGAPLVQHLRGVS